MKILYFDTETTGLSPRGGVAFGQPYLGHICQLTYVMEEGAETVAKNYFFAVDYVEPGASAVNGLNARLLYTLSGGREFSDDFDAIQADFSQADVVVAHNLAFDTKFMQAEYERLSREFIVKRGFCSMKGSADYLRIPSARFAGRYKLPSLAELAQGFGVDEAEVHRVTTELFGNDAGAHDARYDTVKLMLACRKGREVCPQMQEALTEGGLL